MGHQPYERKRTSRDAQDTPTSALVKVKGDLEEKTGEATAVGGDDNLRDLQGLCG